MPTVRDRGPTAAAGFSHHTPQSISDCLQRTIDCLENTKRTAKFTDGERTQLSEEEQEAESGLTADQNKQKQEVQALLEQLQQERNQLLREVELLNQSAESTRFWPDRQCAWDTGLAGVGSQSSRLDSFVRCTEEEQDFCKQEVESLKKMQRSRRSTSPSRSPTRQPPVKGGSYDSQLMRLLRERDDMQSMLDKYERHLAEIQANVKVLTADRDQISMHYQQAQEEIAALRREVMRSKAARCPKSSLTAQSILKRVEAERDEATSDLHRMSTERDSLRERLKISQETAISERAHLEQRIEDLQNTILTLEEERGEQRGRQAQIRESMLGLEEEVHTLGRKLAGSQEALERTKNECSVLRLSSTQADSALSESQRRLTSRIGELQSAQEQNKLLGQRNEDLLREVQALRGEVSLLQEGREELQEQVDRKTDLLTSSNRQLDNQELTIRNLRPRVEELETTVTAQREALSGRERELDAARRRLAAVGEELALALRLKDATLRENAQLRDDLAGARLHSQALQIKLDDSAHEAADLQEKAQDNAANMARTEELLAAKEQECTEQQEARERAVAQGERWQDQVLRAEGSLASARLELRDALAEKLRLRERVEGLETRLQEVLSAERSSSAQLCQRSATQQRVEEELRETRSELEKTRQLCVKLDDSKEAVQRELATCRSDAELLQQRVESERVCVRSLESILTASREKELQRQLSQQERSTETQLLRDRLSLADSRASAQACELAQLKSRAVLLETDLETTRRQLSTERFERERAVQELRRQGLSPVLSSTLRSSPPPRRSWSPGRSSHGSPKRMTPHRSPERSVTFRDLHD